MILFLLTLAGIFLSIVVEHFIPPLQGLRDARVMLMPIFLFYGAVAFPFPVVLLLTFFAGFLYDAIILQIVDGAVEISPGWSIILFGVLCSLMHGTRPLFLKGRWELHCLLCGLLTAVIVLAQYLLLSFRRESFLFNETVWWRVLSPGVIVMVASPFVFFILNWIGESTGYRLTETDKRRRRR